MNGKRIHIFGASGAGTSTLGRALATKLGATYFETDDIYWLPTDPPYQVARERSEREKLLLEAATSSRWVLAGSLCGWGDVVIPYIDVAIFVVTPTELRLQRLRDREHARFGARIAPGGDMYENHRGFIEWASQYDSGNPDMRSRMMHEAWMTKLSCPVTRVDGSRAIDELVHTIARPWAT